MLRKEPLSFSMINKGKQLMVILRKMIGDPLSKSNKYILERFVAATFNFRPPKIAKGDLTWDVNVLLDHFIRMGPNEKISELNTLGGKLALQILISQMCRTNEVAQLRLSTMKYVQNAVEFELLENTKTVRPNMSSAQVRNLQRMKIKEFQGHPLLCPLRTLLHYIERTRSRRGHVDKLFVLVTTQIPRGASRETIVRWGKDIMKNSGLESYSVASSRSAASSSVMLMGMRLDTIINRVGWLRATTFVKYYLKPIQPLLKDEGVKNPLSYEERKAAAEAPSIDFGKKKPKPLPQTGRKPKPPPTPPPPITEPGDLPDPYGFAANFADKTPKTL